MESLACPRPLFCGGIPSNFRVYCLSRPRESLPRKLRLGISSLLALPPVTTLRAAPAVIPEQDLLQMRPSCETEACYRFHAYLRILRGILSLTRPLSPLV